MPGFSMYGFFGSSHRDVMIADPDSIWGHEFYGGAGNDLLAGGVIQYGGAGNDRLVNGWENYGEAGNDLLDGGQNQYGGSGMIALSGASQRTATTVRAMAIGAKAERGTTASMAPISSTGLLEAPATTGSSPTVGTTPP